jgi:hypothetical protein
LHRLLPPLTVGGTAVVLAAASLFSGDTGLLRVLAAATALTAVAGAALARTWDRSAGREVAELTALRARDEWRTDERIAELETDLEESREVRGRLEKKLRARRTELGRLRTEHADLLRRYATAEAERARALEARRKVQREGAAGTAPALGTGTAPLGPAAFLKADDALRNLARSAATQQAQRTVADARRREAAAAEEPQGRHASGAAPALPVREHRTEPASAVLPYAQQPSRGAGAAHRTVGGFDFFGTQKAAAGPHRHEEEQAPAEGTAGTEDAREHGDEQEVPVERESAAQEQEPAEQSGAGSAEQGAEEHGQADAEVIDLTAHDETEQLDMSELRAQA